jgi:hypothetical protein
MILSPSPDLPGGGIINIIQVPVLARPKAKGIVKTFCDS